MRSPTLKVKGHRCDVIRGGRGRRERERETERETERDRGRGWWFRYESHNVLESCNTSSRNLTEVTTASPVHTLYSCMHRRARPSIPWPTPRAAQSKSNIFPIMYAPAKPPTAAPP